VGLRKCRKNKMDQSLGPGFLIFGQLTEEYNFFTSIFSHNQNLADSEKHSTFLTMPSLKKMKFLNNLKGWATGNSKKRKKEEEEKENVGPSCDTFI
jgi:hypothetical protein